MGYELNLGMWNHVFAVPADLVDKHLKLAGAAQLKVILWTLRHAGESFTAEDIAGVLSMQPADVRDAMVYWTETGLICMTETQMTPPEKTPVTKETAPVKEEQPVPVEKTETTEAAGEEKKTEKKPSRQLVSQEKPDYRYLSQRMENDEQIAFLMQTADVIFGRPTSTNEKATLLMIHETDGLPVEVIIMLLQFAAEIGKCNVRYIEKTAVRWSDEEINTIELAEKKIQTLTSGRNAAGYVQKLLGLESHSPSENESEFADRWVNFWKFSGEMIRKAYEICIDAKQKYIPKYVDSILGRWYSSGIDTPERADAEKGKKKKEKKTYEPTYDISEFERLSVIDEEEL